MLPCTLSGSGVQQGAIGLVCRPVEAFAIRDSKQLDSDCLLSSMNSIQLLNLVLSLSRIEFLKDEPEMSKLLGHLLFLKPVRDSLMERFEGQRVTWDGHESF